MASIQQLEREIGELAAEVAELQQQVSADQLAPNFLIVNPDGTIGAQFSGSLRLPTHVVSLPPPPADHPFGVDGDEDAGGDPVVQSLSAVQWVTPSGAAVAEITGATAPDGILFANARSQDQDTVAQLAAIASDAGSASVLAQTYQDGALTQSATLIDQQGRSSFLQLLFGARVLVGPLMQFTGPILAPGVKYQQAVGHSLGTSNIAVFGAVFDAAVNNPSGASWCWLTDGLTASQVVIELQAVGSAAVRVSWRGFAVAFL